MILVVDAERLQQSTIESWEVVLAVLVLILAWILSLFTRRGIRRFGSHLRGVDDELLELAARFGSYTVLFIGIGVSLSVLGAPIQPLLAAAVIFGIVLAISLRGIADNFASGIVIQTRGTIHVNDEIAALGYQGRVRELNGRSVVVETSDGALVHLPNARILS
ncbi:MAG TPA: mechanosensitive ion channel domain-containing protein, partial [Acidimicrobiia bacterium]